MGLDSLVGKGKAPNTVQPKKKLVDYFAEYGFVVIEEACLKPMQNKCIADGLYKHVATISDTESDFKEGYYKVLPPSSTRQGSYLERRVELVSHKEEFYVSAEELIINLIDDAERDPVKTRYLVVKRKHGAGQYNLEIYRKLLSNGNTPDQRILSHQFEQ